MRIKNVENRIRCEYHRAPSTFARWYTIGSVSAARFSRTPQ
jgi:hypothetical protein